MRGSELPKRKLQLGSENDTRRAMTRLAMLYHPDKGGTTEQMVRINKAYEEARKAHPEQRGGRS